MQTFRIVWMSRNLCLDGKLCIRDDEKTAFVYKFLAIAGEHGKRHAMRAHKQPQAVSDWLNPHSLGTVTASVCR